MPPATRQALLLSDVTLDNVEGALEKSIEALEAQGVTVQRNITSCSVIVSHTEDDQKVLHDLISTIAETRAGRIIKVRITAESHEIKTQTALMCTPTKKDQQLCTEIISIEISKRELPALKSLLFQFSLVGVLPVLFLFSSHTTQADLHEIIDTFDSVVFDGRAIPEEVLQYLSAQKKQLADLAWILQSEWRYAVASAFSQRIILSHLESLSEVSITSPTTSSVSDLLLAGWLLHRLELSPEAALTNGYECRSNSSFKVLPLLCHHQESTQSISFKFNKGPVELQVVISNGSGSCLETCITYGEETHRSTIRLSATDLTSCIKRHFAQPENSSNYKRSLEKAFELYRLESGFRS